MIIVKLLPQTRLHTVLIMVPIDSNIDGLKNTQSSDASKLSEFV